MRCHCRVAGSQPVPEGVQEHGRLLLLSEEKSLHLAAGGLREFGEERYLAQIGVKREANADMLL